MSVPECEASQTEIDGLTNGIWEELVWAGESLPDISTDTEWLPLGCRSPEKKSLLGSAGHNIVRIRDAIVPHFKLEVGDVHNVRKKYHKNGSTTSSDCTTSIGETGTLHKRTVYW